MHSVRDPQNPALLWFVKRGVVPPLPLFAPWRRQKQLYLYFYRDALGTSVGCCEHGDEPSGTIRGWDVLSGW